MARNKTKQPLNPLLHPVDLLDRRLDVFQRRVHGQRLFIGAGQADLANGGSGLQAGIEPGSNKALWQAADA